MRPHPTASSTPSTSWQKVSDWYSQSVGKSGHYFHQHVVLPNVIRLLDVPNHPEMALLDLACGQGVLERALPKEITYYGVDIASDLVKYARQHQVAPSHEFRVGDAAKKLLVSKQDFTHITCILALQNIRHIDGVMQNAATHLGKEGKFIIVLNHPSFRIPRQSSWEVDESKKTQYRKIERYMSDLEIPISAHPGQKNSQVTWSFHHPLSIYTKALSQAGFVIENIEEWLSDKTSEGKAAKMENRSRQEFPLFLTIIASKK